MITYPPAINTPREKGFPLPEIQRLSRIAGDDFFWRYGYNSQYARNNLAGKNLGGYRMFIQLSTEA
jgi:hypothetical protein